MHDSPVTTGRQLVAGDSLRVGHRSGEWGHASHLIRAKGRGQPRARICGYLGVLSFRRTRSAGSSRPLARAHSALWILLGPGPCLLQPISGTLETFGVLRRRRAPTLRGLETFGVPGGSPHTHIPHFGYFRRAARGSRHHAAASGTPVARPPRGEPGHYSSSRELSRGSLGLVHRRPSRSEPSDRDTERRARHVVEADALEELDRGGIATVLATDAALQLRLGLTIFVTPISTSAPTPSTSIDSNGFFSSTPSTT